MSKIQNANVAVVGGAGFLGSHLVNYLIQERNCRVWVIDNLVVGNRHFVHSAAEFVHHDITSSEEYLRKLFQRHEIQYVFNYAAYPYIPDSFERPLQVWNVNAMGALKVINAAQEAGVERILQVSSAEIYGSHSGLSAIDENHPVVPHSSYGASKAAIDFVVQARWKENKTPCIALRQFNCIGERETHPYVVPEIITQLLGRGDFGQDTSIQKAVRLGNNSRRDFMYAGDAVRGAVELLERGELGEVYNLGSKESIAIYDLAALIGRILGLKVVVDVDPAKIRPWEIWALRSDNTKIEGFVETANFKTLEKALEFTIQDYLRNGYSWNWQQ